MRTALGAMLALALLVACSSGSSQQASPSSAPVDEAVTSDLVYWSALDFYGDAVPEASRRALDSITRDEDERFVPYLLDLMALPTPFRVDAVETLRRWLGEEGDFGPFGWVEQRGFRKAEEDTALYLEFKQQIFRAIQPELGDFLRPGAKKTISAQEVMWGGVAVDGIPPLEEPKFITPAEAREWILTSDEVIGVEINGDARAYPRRIIDWHEMVNDTVGGVPVSLAYCTLCGSAILYDGRHGGTVYRFGTSGMLYRSNKLMYDRQTRTLWEQYAGEPVWGDLVGRGIRLKTLPVVHTTYGEWLREHPATKVLDINTGFRRDYGSGVAYAEYFADDQLMFPAPDRSGPLNPKDVVYAVRVDGELSAYSIRLLKERGYIEDRVGPTDVVVFVTADGTGARGYTREGLSFSAYDRERGTATSTDGHRWEITEAALVAGDGSRLERLPGHNSFWFSVINHTTNGRLYGQ